MISHGEVEERRQMPTNRPRVRGGGGLRNDPMAEIMGVRRHLIAVDCVMHLLRKLGLLAARARLQLGTATVRVQLVMFRQVSAELWSLLGLKGSKFPLCNNH